MLPSGYRREDGMSAGRDQDRIRRKRAVAIGKLDLVRACERGAGQVTRDARFSKVRV